MLLIGSILALLQATPDTLVNDLTRVTPLDWTVQEVVTIGRIGSDVEISRLTDARVFQDGFVILDEGQKHLLLLDGEGVVIAVVGRNGDGPGEFRDPVDLIPLAGDSIGVFDIQSQRVSFFAGREAVWTGRPWPAASPPWGEVYRTADGDLVAFTRPRVRGGIPGSLRRDTITAIGIHGTTGDAVGLGSFPGPITTTFSTGGRRAYRWVPYTPSLETAAQGRCYYALTTDSGALQVGDLAGKTITLFNRLPAQAVGQREIEAWIDWLLTLGDPQDVDPEALKAQRTVLQGLQTPENMPIFNDLIVDDEGAIWMEAFEAPSGRSGRWFVLDAAGRPVGMVQLPPADVLAIRRDTILMRAEGELGEQYLRVLALDRGPNAIPRSGPPPGRSGRGLVSLCDADQRGP